MSHAVPPDLLQAYRATRVHAELPDGPVELPAADEAPLAELPSVLRDGAWVLTAWNPRSEQLSRSENDARSDRLAQDLLDLGATRWPAWGRARDGGWEEASWLAVGLRRTDALALGERYGQHAIFWLGSDGLEVVLGS